ncbi:hypothetical protein [uncultured Streptomyces sp.]|uniref:hypothetical protein n=1 Tax=uncultured Streptomyces sp. TaxID=174707 RepID=UPI0026324762|nr:hypothetical protein [uncultured Streptomyces sp.]
MTPRAETLVPHDTHDTFAPHATHDTSAPQDGLAPVARTQPEEEPAEPGEALPSSGRLGLRLGCALFAAPGAPDAARLLLGLPPETAAQEPAEPAGPAPAAVLPWWPRPAALGTPPDRHGRPGR